ncbi:hypothetical protein CPC08DRAFT_709814 [Agrocybe pediades]|nr:hypothetical protein CPC08DRAFT_709814 [Agrocybe pediades]
MTVGPISPSAFVLQSNEDLGAVQVTTFISLVMFGVLLSQGYIYFSRNEDRPSLQYMVGFLLFMEACHSFTSSQVIYYDTVTRYLTTQPNSYPLTTSAVIENIITALVQSFFCYRIYRLSEGCILLTVACLTLILLRLVGGMTLAVYSFIDVSTTPNGIVFVVKLSWLITSSLACGAAADVLIAALMLYYLRQLDSPHNHTPTTQIINRLIRFSLQTGLLTSMASVTVIICFQAMQNMIWFSFYVLLAKVYSNSLLASLNARPQMRRQVVVTPAISTLLAFEAAPPISVSFRTTQASRIASNVHTRSVELPSRKSEGEEEGDDHQGL